MVDKTSRSSRKAAGSSNRIGSSVSQGRFHRQSEGPQAPPSTSPYRDDNGEDGDEYPENTNLQRHRTRAPRTSRLAQLLEAQQDEPRPNTSTANRTSSFSRRASSWSANHTSSAKRAFTSDRTSSADHTNLTDRTSKGKSTSNFNEGDTIKDSSESGDDWEELPREVPLPSSPSTSRRPTTPSYDFPRTWPAAINDSAEALSQVGSATKSYASALTRSGIGKASWSIGAAALNTTNRYALNLAGWGMAQTGLMPSELPGPFKKWVIGREEANKRKKLATERRRRLQLLHGETVEATFDDEHGSFKLDLHQTDADGEFVASAPSSYPKKIGWKEEAAAERFDGPVRERGDYEEEKSDEEEEDGLLRVFEIDDE